MQIWNLLDKEKILHLAAWESVVLSLATDDFYFLYLERGKLHFPLIVTHIGLCTTREYKLQMQTTTNLNTKAKG